jgi:hypothetical protein
MTRAARDQQVRGVAAHAEGSGAGLSLSASELGSLPLWQEPRGVKWPPKT